MMVFDSSDYGSWLMSIAPEPGEDRDDWYHEAAGWSNHAERCPIAVWLSQVLPHPNVRVTDSRVYSGAELIGYLDDALQIFVDLVDCAQCAGTETEESYPEVANIEAIRLLAIAVGKALEGMGQAGPGAK